MYDGLEGTFRTVRLRGRQSGCPVCGDSPSITKLIDYEQFCGARATDKVSLSDMLNKLGLFLHKILHYALILVFSDI